MVKYMTNMTKKELLKTTKKRYIKANKADKTKILDEFCINTGYNRKYAITILQAGYDHNKIERIGRKNRQTVYGHNVLAVAVKVWELLEYPCGVRLKPILIPTIEALIRHKEITVSDDILKKLKTISPSTLDRGLVRERQIRKLNRNRGTTRHGTLLKTSIPIRLTNWDTSKAGFMEMDTVAHNGGDPSGSFIYSLDMVEIYSGWSVQRAVLGKGRKGIVDKIDEIKHSVPFRILGLDSDTGAEFINWHMVEYCKLNNLSFTRSRPDRKNDNAYVEQKNYTHIRKWLGYKRYDTEMQLKLINDLYKNEMNLFNNFFRPVMKIEFKEKINNSTCKKKYDIAQTPYQRLMNSKEISPEIKKELQELYLSLNPFELKKRIIEKINIIKKS